jgi:DNA-binding MarR family transcriptional regulator
MVAMTTRHLRDEIKQTRPFRSLEEEVLLGLARTADAVQRGFAGVFKAAGLSTTQYNVLRILRGAGSPGLSCGEIAERMVTRDPDLTRLLDRLEARQLATRARDGGDRRVVTTRITQAGLDLLDELEGPLVTEQRRLLGHMGAGQLRQLADLLDEARSGQA